MKKYLLRIVTLLAFLAGVVFIYKGIDYVVSDDTEMMTRLTIHDLYEQDKIDIAFVGTSHIVYSIDAKLMSEKTGKSVYNMATSSQDLDGTYAMLKELFDNYDPEQVFVELSTSRMFIEQSSATYIYIITDFIKSLTNRTEYLLKAFDSSQYINSFFRLRRNLNPLELPEVTDLMDIYKKKQTENYKNYTADGYDGLGLWPDYGTLGPSTGASIYLDSTTFDDYSMSDVKDVCWDKIKNIVDLCNKEGVKLTFYISPYSEAFIMLFDIYEEVTALMKDKAAELGVPVADMNLVKENYFFFDADDYINGDHVNAKAGKEISAFMAEYIKNPDGDYFYKNLQDRYPHDNKVKYAGYTRKFTLTNGKTYKDIKKAKSKGTIKSFTVDVSPIAYQDFPVETVLTKVKKENDKWVDVQVIEGEAINMNTTRYELPFDNYVTCYKIQFFEPDTHELLFEVIQRFHRN